MLVALGGCSSGGNSSYAQASTSATGCPGQISVGDQVELTAKVTNKSASSWPATVIWLDGADNFVRNLVDDTGATGTDQGVGQWNFASPLDAGQTRTITIDLTAKSAGNNTVSIEGFGGAANNINDLPDAPAVSCGIAINP